MNVFGVKKENGQSMRMHNLDTKKYKRFFAFECSFTNYKWPTWADIIGQDIEFYQNWAMPGAGNHFIFNSVIEADARYHYNKDDLVIIFWSTKEREDRYHNNVWLNDNNTTQEKTYGKEWVMRFGVDFRGFLVRDMAYMKAIQDIMKNKDCDWVNFTWHELFNSSHLRQTSNDKESLLRLWREKSKEIYLGGSIADFFDDRDVIKLYQDVFTNVDAMYKWFEVECIHHRTAPDNDLHPMPMEALQFLDWLWPNNTLSDKARKYALSWDYSNKPYRPPISRL